MVLLVLALGLAAFFYFDVGRGLSLGALMENRDRLLVFTRANYSTAVGLFIGSYATATGLSLFGAAILTLAGGFLFGSILGTLFVNLGATTGATLSFLVARTSCVMPSNRNTGNGVQSWRMYGLNSLRGAHRRP